MDMSRFMEFGMGMSMARTMGRQMSRTMNNIQKQNTRNDGQAPQKPGIEYYAVIDGKQAGPFNENELAVLISNKKISNETYIWHTGLREWKTAENIPAILKITALMPPPPPKGV